MIQGRELVYLITLIKGIDEFFHVANPQNAFKTDLVLAGQFTYQTLLDTAAQHPVLGKKDFLDTLLARATQYSLGTQTSPIRQPANGERMRSVFEDISLRQHRDGTPERAKELPVQPLSMEASVFPVAKGVKAGETDYAFIRQNLEKEMEIISGKGLRSYNDSLLALLEKHLSFVPAAAFPFSDISLYDHLKIQAAFALCLYDALLDKKDPETGAREGNPMALVGGALSGIQSFIYSIVAKRAAQNLKGRSFYLQLLVDNVVEALLDKLGLQKGNIVYASGGGFYLLAPHTADLPERLKELEQNIAAKLFDHHKTELYLALDFAPFGEQEIFGRSDKGATIGTTWQALGENLSRKKGQRFSELIKADFGRFFQPDVVNPESKKDAITGQELGKELKTLEDGRPVNLYTWKQIALGKELKRADYWVLSKEPIGYLPEKAALEPIRMGLYNYLLDASAFSANEAQLKKLGDNMQVVSFNKSPNAASSRNGYGLAWYGGNDFPENKFGDPKTFDELAGTEFDKSGNRDDAKKVGGPELTRLGVLRMDVDNLGAIFRSGLHPSQRCFSRYSTLSRSLDWFFKGYLNTIWNQKADYQQYTQIIYSGGDDLFIVGKWDVLLYMAADIQAAFRKWVCENPELTLSGGMAIVGARFPILKSAAYSETQEKAAKKHRYGQQEKNAFAFISYVPQEKTEPLYVALNWETEFPYLRRLKEEIQTLLTMKDGLSEGFPSAMYNLMQQAGMERQKDGSFYPKEHRVSWLAAYQFKRNSNDKSDVLKDFFRKWGIAIMTGKPPGEDAPKDTQYHALQYLALAARWAALENRSAKKH